MTRSGTAICGAARPMPGAAYMVSTMSWTSAWIVPSMFATGADGSCSMGCPNFTMGRRAMAAQFTTNAPGRQNEPTKFTAEDAENAERRIENEPRTASGARFTRAKRAGGLWVGRTTPQLT